jgi:hypothetical protein
LEPSNTPCAVANHASGPQAYARCCACTVTTRASSYNPLLRADLLPRSGGLEPPNIPSPEPTRAGTNRASPGAAAWSRRIPLARLQTTPPAPRRMPAAAPARLQPAPPVITPSPEPNTSPGAAAWSRRILPRSGGLEPPNTPCAVINRAAGSRSRPVRVQPAPTLR